MSTNGEKFSRGESFSTAALLNKSADHVFDAPGGIAFRLNPDGYGKASTAERDKVAKFVNDWIERTKDPASEILGAPLLFGQDVAPHAMTFASKIGSQAKTYLPSDESLEANQNDALLMRKDLGIMECLEIRQRMTALLDWSIVPEDTKSPAQKSVAAELTKILKRIRRWTEYRRCLMDAIWIGRSAIQHTYGHANIGGKMYCFPRAKHADATGWKHIHGDKVVFRYDDGEKMANGAFPDQMGIRVSAIIPKDSRIRGIQDIEYTNSGAAIFLSPAERQTVICHKHMIEDAEYNNPRKAGRLHGVGIRDRIYNEWFLKQEILGFLMEYMERSAGGIEIYEYPSGDDAAKRSVMEAAKNRMAFGRNQIFFPKPLGMDSGVYDLRIVEPGFAGMDMLVNIQDKYFGHRIKRYIIGQTLSTEADATGLGSSVADFQKDSLSQIVMYDSNNLQETMTHELVRPIQLANWPETESWQFELKHELESDNVKERLDGYKSAWEMGLGIPEKDVAEAIGVSLDNPNEKILKNAAAGGGGAPGMGNGMQFPAGTGFGNQIDAAHAHVKAAGEVKGLQDGVIDHVAGKLGEDKGDDGGAAPSSPAGPPDQYSRDFNEDDHPRNPSGNGTGGRFTSAPEAPSSSADEDSNDLEPENIEPAPRSPQLTSDQIAPIPAPKKMRADRETIWSYGGEIFDLANAGHTPEQIAQQLLEEHSTQFINDDDLSAFHKAAEDHLTDELSDINEDEEITIDGQDWEDWLSDTSTKMAESAVLPTLAKDIKTSLEQPVDKDTREEIIDYLDSVKHHPVKRNQFAQKIIERWPVLRPNAEAIVKSHLGTDNYQRRSERLLHEAASMTNTSPTEAQREAGNYSKGVYSWKGMEIAIENPKNSTRSGCSSSGREWSRTMVCHYGYFRRTLANDGDNLDVFIGKHPESDFVLVVKQVDQRDKDKFDEFKVVVGCLNRNEAKKLYLANYPAGWKCGPAAGMTVELFKRWTASDGPMKAKSLAKVEKYSREFTEEDHPRDNSGKFTESSKTGDSISIPELGRRSAFDAHIIDSDDPDNAIVSSVDKEGKPYWKTSVPKKSLHQFHSDLTGDFSYLQKFGSSGNESIDAVISGKGKMIGKGDDSVVFETPDGKIVKASTTVPYHPVGGPTHFTPDAAMQQAKVKFGMLQDMKKAGVAGIPDTVGIEHGDKFFTVQEKMQIGTPMNREQLQQVKDSVESMHKAGYEIQDELQVGIGPDGKAKHYDLGKAGPASFDMRRTDEMREVASLWGKNSVNWHMSPEEAMSQVKVAKTMAEIDKSNGKPLRQRGRDMLKKAWDSLNHHEDYDNAFALQEWMFDNGLKDIY